MKTTLEKPRRRLFGVIKEFKQTYGFIEAEDGASHFVHRRDLPPEWRPERYRDQLAGKCVVFEVHQAANSRPKAVRVFVIAEEDEHRIGAEIAVADVA